MTHTPPALPPHTTFLERGWLSANSVVFTGPEGAAVVDTGYCSHAEQTVALVQAALGGRALERILNTHLHSDHCGGNAALQATWPQVQTWVPPGQAHAVRNWDPVALSYQPTGQECPRFRLEGTLQPGTSVQLGGRAWQVHAAPGHDPHAVLLFEPQDALLISGDALWENGFGVVFPELEGAEAFAAVASGRLAGGFVNWTRQDGLTEFRTITNHVGNQITLDYGADDLAAGLDMTVFPGCAHNWADCKDYFNNGANYGGCLYLPQENPFAGNFFTPVKQLSEF